MGEAQAMQGVKIVRPGLNYYFDDATPKCPVCGSPDLEYRCRVKDTPRTAQFKCTSNACLCKFEKTRTVETEPEGYSPSDRSANPIFAVSCADCGHGLNMKLADFETAERVACRECGAVLKSRTGPQTGVV